MQTSEISVATLRRVYIIIFIQLVIESYFEWCNSVVNNSNRVAWSIRLHEGPSRSGDRMVLLDGFRWFLLKLLNRPCARCNRTSGSQHAFMYPFTMSGNMISQGIYTSMLPPQFGNQSRARSWGKQKVFTHVWKIKKYNGRASRIRGLYLLSY